MLDLASVTHPLRCVVTATALVAAGVSTASAQTTATSIQEPSRPSVPSVGDDDTASHRRREPPGAILHDMSLFDDRHPDRATPGLAVDWLSGVEMACIGCRGVDTAGAWLASASANAPWVLQGRWRRQTRLGLVSTGFIGVRNSALPLAAVTRLGGDLDRIALRTSGTGGFLPGSRWSVTAGVEKTLATRANGSSVGVAADVFIPATSHAGAVDDPRARDLASPTIRVGIVLRW